MATDQDSNCSRMANASPARTSSNGWLLNYRTTHQTRRHLPASQESPFTGNTHQMGPSKMKKHHPGYSRALCDVYRHGGGKRPDSPTRRSISQLTAPSTPGTRPSPSATGRWACCCGAKATRCGFRWTAAISGTSALPQARCRGDRFNWATMQQLVAGNRMAEFHEIFDSNYDYNGSPTKLPAGRVEIRLDPSQTVEAFELNLATAEGLARLPAAANCVPSSTPPAWKNRWPWCAFPARRSARSGLRARSHSASWAMSRRVAKRTGWILQQQATNGFTFADVRPRVAAGVNEHLLAVTVSTSREGPSPQAVARRRVERALRRLRTPRGPRMVEAFLGAFPRLRAQPHILQHYYLVRYFYGPPRAGARRRCRCKASGRRMPDRSRRGRATTTTTSTRR